MGSRPVRLRLVNSGTAWGPALHDGRGGRTVRSCMPEEVAPVVAEEPAVERGPVLDCTTYPYKHFSKRLRDKLPEYKHLSLGAGVAPVADENILEKLITQRSVGSSWCALQQRMRSGWRP